METIITVCSGWPGTGRTAGEGSGQAGLEAQAGEHKEGNEAEGAGRVPLNLFSSTISGSHTMSGGRRRTVMFPKSLASHCSRLSVQA